MDGSTYINDLDVVRSTDIYGETLASKNGMVWKSVPKGNGDTYLTNRSDKIVLYREIFDLTQKKTLGYIAIGVSQEYFQNLCPQGTNSGSIPIRLDCTGLPAPQVRPFQVRYIGM